MFKTYRQQRRRKVDSITDWVESNFCRRQCSKFIPTSKDNSRCVCGDLWQYHSDGSPATLQTTCRGREGWSPAQNTSLLPTNAYGTLAFQGSALHPVKSQYVRVAYDTRAEQLQQLLTTAWRLQLPKLVVTVYGGRSNFELPAKLKKALRRGLLRTARTTGAWIISGGINTGVSRFVGDSLASGHPTGSSPGHRPVCIGVAPWGAIQGSQDVLIALNKEVPYCSRQHFTGHHVSLNSRHTHFLLADNGSVGYHGAEYRLRRNLERHLSRNLVISGVGAGTPLVCVVVEGGIDTVRVIRDLVHDTPPVPVVVCEGTGRVADIVAFVHRYSQSESDSSLLQSPSVREHVLTMVSEALEVTGRQAERLLADIQHCCTLPGRITVYNYQQQEQGDGGGGELDETILRVLLNGQSTCWADQLSLTLSWNRVDLARSIVFAENVEFNSDVLEQAMMDALITNRTDFVELLLDQGLLMSSFLTIDRLEQLYNDKHGPWNSLHYILADVRANWSRASRFTLPDIGLVINHLMGGAYRSNYTRRKFRSIYVSNHQQRHHQPTNSAAIKSFLTAAGEGDCKQMNGGLGHSDTCPEGTFLYPYSELLIWAVLTKRQDMARVMWQRDEEALAKALVACKLYKALAAEAADDNLATEFCDDLKQYADEFAALALQLVELAAARDRDYTQQLLTYQLSEWSGQTCLSLAVAADLQCLLALPCCQVLLAELWMGGLRLRRNSNIRVALSLLFPPLMFGLEFRTRQELRKMPRTEHEYVQEQEEQEQEDEYEAGEEIEERHDNITDYHHHFEEDDVFYSQKPDSERNYPGRSYSRGSFRCRSFSFNAEPVSFKSAPSSVVHDSVTTPSGDHLDNYSLYRARPRQLRLGKKIYEFYTAPITKFWGFTLSYVLFLGMLTYMVLIRMSLTTPNWSEMFVSLYVLCLAVDMVRDILLSEPYTLRQRLGMWLSRWWNMCDAVFILSYLFLQPLRFYGPTFRWARVCICCNSIYWYLRLFEIFSVEKYLGPMVTIVGRMLVKMLHFIVLLAIILFSFGVLRQSIRRPNEQPNWYLLRHVFYQPYFMLYGEVFAPDIEPEQCADPNNPDDADKDACELWVTVVGMTIYLLVANILMLNLLVAIFNNIFSDMFSVAHQLWMFQRYRLVVSYEMRSVCPPPLALIEHVLNVVRYLCCRSCHSRGGSSRTGLDHPGSHSGCLKLFVDRDGLECIHDFEEECVAEYLRRLELKQQHSGDKLAQLNSERLESCLQRLDDLSLRQQSHSHQCHQLDFRLQRLEDKEQEERVVAAAGGGDSSRAAAQLPELSAADGGGERHLSGGVPQAELRRRRLLQHLHLLAQVSQGWQRRGSGQPVSAAPTRESSSSTANRLAVQDTRGLAAASMMVAGDDGPKQESVDSGSSTPVGERLERSSTSLQPSLSGCDLTQSSTPGGATHSETHC